MKKQTRKCKILSLFLVFCMVLCMMPNAAFASDQTNDNAGIRISYVEDSYNASTGILKVRVQAKLPNGTGITSLGTVLSYDNTKLNIVNQYNASMEISGTDGVLINPSDAAFSVSMATTNDYGAPGAYTVANGDIYKSGGRNALYVYLMNTDSKKKPNSLQTGGEWFDCYEIMFKVTGNPADPSTVLDSNSLRIADSTKDNVVVQGAFPANNIYNVYLTDNSDPAKIYVLGKMSGCTDIEVSGEKSVMAASGTGIATYPGSTNMPPKPALGGSVAIAGTPVIGNNLSVNKSSLDYNGATEGTLSYQWKAGETEVGTDATYTVQSADFGKTITVTVTNSNNSSSVTSAATAAVEKKDYSGSGATAATVNKTANTVTVSNKQDGQEYAITTGASEPTEGWNNTGVFTELTPNTTYTVYTRVAETADTKASASLTTSVTTDKLTQTITVPTGEVKVTYGKTYELSTVCSTDASGNKLTYTLEGTLPTGTTFNASTGKVDATVATAEGTFIVKVNAGAFGAYNAAAEKTVTVRIANKPAATVETAPAAKSGLKYTGSAQALITAGSANGGTLQYKLEGGSYGEAIPTATDAGTYTVYYYVKGDTEHSDSAVSSFTVTIDKVAASVTAAPAAKSGLVYTGAALELITEGTPYGGEMQYSLTSGTGYSSAFPTGTNAGTYTVYYKVVGDSNHNDTAEASISVSIAKANASVVKAPTAVSGLVYTNTAHALIAAGTANGGTLQYKVGDGIYSATIPTATDAGTHKVYYKVVGDDNHNDSAEAFVNVEIAKADASVTTIPTAKSGLKYNGSAQALITAGSANGGTLQYKLGTGSYGTEIPTATNAGDYTVYYKVVGDSNHNDTADGSIAVSIAKVDASLATAPTAKSGLEYNGSAQELITAGDANGGTLQYKLGTGDYGTTIPKATNAGTYTVYYKVVGDGNHNDSAGSSVSVTIAKANASVNTAPAANAGLKYTGSAQELITSGTPNGGEMQYSLTSGSGYSTDIPTATNAGTYTVFYKVVGDGNHNDSAESSVSVIIGKANASVGTAPTAKTGLKYTGSAQELIAAGTPNGGEMQYSLTSESGYSTDIPTATNAGTYTVFYKVIGDSNHSDTAEESVSVTIEKADAPAAPTVTGSYGVSTTDPSKFVYTVNAIVGAEYSNDGTTYQESNIFDGINPAASVTFYARMKETSNVKVGVAGNTGAVTFNKLENTNVPVLQFNVTGDSGNRTITISSASGAEYAFDDGAFGSTNVKSGINDATVTVKIRYAATETLNASAAVTASVNTAKDIQTVSFDSSSVDKKYGDAKFTVAASNNKEDGGAIQYSSSNTDVAVVDAASGEVTIKGAGNVSIKASAAENDMYGQSSEAYYTLNVAKATITITANNKTAYIGDSAPALGEADYTVTGLAAGESLKIAPAIAYAYTPDMTQAGTVSIEVSGAVAPDGGNYNAIVYQNGTLTISARPSSIGGGYVPTAQKPEIKAAAGGKAVLSADGTTLIITPNKGKVVDKVLVNGKDMGAVTELKGLKTGDKVEVIFKDEVTEPTKAELDETVKEAVKGLAMNARSSKLKNGNIKIVANADASSFKELGYTVKYKFYRSTKKASGYKATVTKTEPVYINTAGKKGTMYYYKVRVLAYDQEGNLVAQSDLKQCRYANRLWTK